MKAIAVILSVAAATATSSAQPVNYVFSGEGTGSIGALSFVDFAFEIHIAGDLEDIFFSDGGNPIMIDSAATISFDGLVTDAIFIDTVSLVVSSNRLVFGSWDANRAISIMSDPEFEGYELGAPFGPVTDLSPDRTQFVNIQTNMGSLSFWDISFMTFESTMIPTPATLAILPLAGLVATRRRRMPC